MQLVSTKQRLAILVESPFTSRDFERLGLETLKEHFDVEVLDFTAWLIPHVWQKAARSVYNIDGYRSITCQQDCNSHLLNGSFDLAIDYLGKKAEAIRLRHDLRKRQVRRVIVASGVLPQPRRSLRDRVDRLRHRTGKLRYFFAWLQRFVADVNFGSVPPDIAVVSGSASLNFPGIESARKIWAHSLDYDIYLGLPAETPLLRRHIVYLDEDPAYHSDFFHQNLTPPVRPENYYPALMRFFERLEQETGCKVIFASHPRARWDERLHLLEGRRPIYGKTAELVRCSSLVLAHASTSISFAILENVPLVFLTTDEMNLSTFRKEVLLRAEILNAPVINLDRFGGLPKNLQVNKSAYAKYKEAYLKTPGSPEMPVWEIFVQAIQTEQGQRL